ncbi:MAG: anthranilate synthase component I family protein [Planctomycetes bacterium]|nr:anthranilate synthase component I family protein [Planctomycetota bacterium]
MAASRETIAGAPLVMELSPAPDTEAAFQRFAALPHCVFFDSARRDTQLGRYSFLAADPYEFIEAHEAATAWPCWQTTLDAWRAETVPGLPPFQGGLAGLVSYDLGRQLEPVPAAAHDEFRLPLLALGCYDVVLAWDHVAGRAWLISQGAPAREPAERSRRAKERLETFLDVLHRQPFPSSPANDRPKANATTITAPQFAVPGFPGLTSNFSREQYLRTVERAIEYVAAGDIFQVNLSQRLLYPAVMPAPELYRHLRRCNPATFSGYFDLGAEQLVSASPERFLHLSHGAVEARPIKGTRPRTARAEADLFAGDDLQASEKDRAENVMIVDLLRNDLSRVCQPDSVHVTQLCSLERYEFVQHLVSAVRGQVRAELGPLDLWRATIPGGSITGAPKVRAMQIISELEPTARGPYCGNLFYLGYDGAMDSSILIRTLTVAGGWYQFPVGGGIVAQSDPRAEYDETWHKAAGLLEALRPFS